MFRFEMQLMTTITTTERFNKKFAGVFNAAKHFKVHLETWKTEMLVNVPSRLMFQLYIRYASECVKSVAHFAAASAHACKAMSSCIN